jgi:small-conductance mechanosensitive channel/molybdopterin converting factor small subunit
MRIRTLFRNILLLAVTLLVALPARSVVPEKDFQTTLNSLLQELRQSYATALESDTLLVNNREQRERFSEVLKSADEVTIMLYTQRPEFTFDMAFALEAVSRISGTFHEQVLLSDQYRVAARSGLRRYELLNETLLAMLSRQSADSLSVPDSLSNPSFPPEEEDPEKGALLDSCLHYTSALTTLYSESVALALKDSILCAETEARLRQAYDYAQANYAATQKNRYIGGNVNIVQILTGWKGFVQLVRNDLRMRYSSDTAAEQAEDGTVPRTFSGRYVLAYAVLALVMLLLSILLGVLIGAIAYRWIKSEKWIQFRPIITAILSTFLFVLGMLLIKADRGNPYWRMAYQLLTQFAWLTLAILISLLIRIRGDQARASLRIYIPTLLLAFACILMRAIFLPASAVPLFFPAALLLFIVWQSIMNIRCRPDVSRTDLRYMWVSVIVMSVTGALSMAGYSMIGVLLITFWTFLLALLHTITTLYYLMMRYYDDRVIRQKARYHQENPKLPLNDKDAFIEVTWLYDLLRMVVVPIITIYSFPLSVLLTSRAYQLSLTGADLMKLPLLRREGYESFTLSNILLVLALFFLFRYLIYLVKAMFRVFKLRNMIDERGDDAVPIKESDVNLSLPNTIFSLLGWLMYLIIAFSILHLPMKALTYITTGLAAGVGFALKDLINNFFYGIQLMAGRIRIGDKISCDGVRGIVKRVSYQTTQVEDEDGSLIAFTNTDLFTKKFRNLNTGRNYEFIKMPVSVRYGTDIEMARQVILEALKPLMTKDKVGRDIVDPSFPVDVRFDSYGDSSVNLVVALYTTVETHYTFPARAKEAIYNAFYENGIEIPFPQRDVYIKPVPGNK